MPSKNEAYLRHAFCYLQFLEVIEQFNSEEGKLEKAIRHVLNLEWENMNYAQKWSSANYKLDNKIAKLCSDYGLAASSLRSMYRHPRDLLNWSTAGLSAARFLNDSYTEVEHLNVCGVAFTYIVLQRHFI